ncbi:MAG: hypothetical protein F6K11_29915, partial [Leptolyngbya sp. SIO3F4]|nr:hypothetical protein [Leptolyngbya sp. SIO3F4]
MHVPAVNASTELLLPYKYLKNVGHSAISQTWVAKDTRKEENALCIIQKLDFHTDDQGLVRYGQTLLGHKVHTLQTLFKDIGSTYTIYDSFSEGQSFYVVQSLVKGTSVHRLRLQEALLGSQVLVILSQILTLLQQSYSWGLGSCCLQPGDLIQQQSDRTDWIWTGAGILKKVVQQVGEPYLALTDLFPKDTSAYFSPECLQGRVDISSDLYTVGVSLVQVLTQLPIKDLVHGSSGYFTIRRNWYHQRQLPDVLVETLNRMIHPNPSKRYSTITDVLSDH